MHLTRTKLPPYFETYILSIFGELSNYPSLKHLLGTSCGGRFRQVLLHMVDVAEQADQHLTRP